MIPRDRGGGDAQTKHKAKVRNLELLASVSEMWTQSLSLSLSFYLHLLLSAFRGPESEKAEK